MAATYKSSSFPGSQGNVSSITCTKPADAADGDYVVFILAQDGTRTVTDAGGLTHIGTQAAPGNDAVMHVFGIYLANAAGAPGTWTVTTSSAGAGSRVCSISATGVDSTTQMDVAASFSTETSANPSASITPITNGCLLIGANVTDPTSGTYTGTPTSSPQFTERIEGGVSATSNLYVETYEQATAASVTTNPTMSSSDDYATVLLALRPVATSVDVTAVAAVATAASPAPTAEVGIPGMVAAAGAIALAPATEVGVTSVASAASAAAPAPSLTILVEIAALAAAATARFLGPLITIPTGRNAGPASAGAGGTRATAATAGAVTPITPGTAGAGGTRSTPATPGSGSGRG